MKLLPEGVLKKQYMANGKLKFRYNDYTIHHIEKKQLSIRKGRHTVVCHDIEQYYDDKKLEVTYQKTISRPLSEQYLATKARRKYYTLSNYLRSKKEIRRYCIEDCRLTNELAEFTSLFTVFDVPLRDIDEIMLSQMP